MTQTTARQDAHRPARSRAGPPRRGLHGGEPPTGAATRRAALAAVAVLALAGAVALAPSGSPVWGGVRVAAALAVGALLTRAVRTAGPRVAGWTAVAVGAVVVPAAGALSAGTLSTDPLTVGPALRGGAAALAAAAGAVLAGAGTVWLLRAARAWWRLLALPVAAVVLQLVVVPVSMAVLVTNPAPATLGDATPADQELPFEDVRLTTPDGVRLAGWYVPSPGGAAVLLLHGSGSTRAATLDHAAALADLGYGVLMVDARGHGESGGTPMALGWHGAGDLAVAVDWLAARPEVDRARIGAVGLSMGGEEALTLASRDPRVRAVVGDGVGHRVAGDAIPAGRLPGLVNALTTAATDLLTAASPPPPLPEVVRALRPGQAVLLVAADGEGAQAAWYAQGAPERVAVWDVPDAAHTRALELDPDEWAARVGAFLATALGAGPGDAATG